MRLKAHLARALSIGGVVRRLLRSLPVVGGEVSSERRHAIFLEVVRPEEKGFEALQSRRGWFVRPKTDEIFHVLHHYTGKSRTGIIWGVSLAFVPHKWEVKPQFHRTVKSAQTDLFEQVWDVENRSTYIDGERKFRRELKRGWRLSEPRAESFWARAASIAEIASLARDLIDRPLGRHGSTTEGQFPSPRLVLAFTLARLGQEADARDALEDWKQVQEGRDDPGIDQALGLVLDRVR